MGNSSEFAKSANVNIGESLKEESLKPLPLQAKTEIIVRGVKHLCQNEDDYSITIMQDFNVVSIKFENDQAASDFLKIFNNYLLDHQSSIIEEVTGEDARKFYRNFIFYEAVSNYGILTLTWR